MKKLLILTFLISSLVSSYEGFAQVTYTKPEKADHEWLFNNQIYHSFTRNEYSLVIFPQYDFNDATWIKLGDTKEVAISSLEAICQMMEEAENNGTIIINNRRYTIMVINSVKYIYDRPEFNSEGNFMSVNSIRQIIRKLKTMN